MAIRAEGKSIEKSWGKLSDIAVATGKEIIGLIGLRTNQAIALLTDLL